MEFLQLFYKTISLNFRDTEKYIDFWQFLDKYIMFQEKMEDQVSRKDGKPSIVWTFLIYYFLIMRMTWHECWLLINNVNYLILISPKSNIQEYIIRLCWKTFGFTKGESNQIWCLSDFGKIFEQITFVVIYIAVQNLWIFLN